MNMDEKAKEIWERLEAEIASLKERLAALEEEVALYRPADGETPEDLPAPEEAPVPVDLPVPEDLPEPEELPEPEDLPAPEETVQAAPVDLSDVEALQDGDTFVREIPVPPVPEETVPEPPAPPKREFRKPDGQYRWQKDMPGAPVKNIRSGISLYDRALFINTLFNEDFSRYDATVAALNDMDGFDEAVDYLLGEFPDWNYAGDAVYAFMMAIRKKLK